MQKNWLLCFRIYKIHEWSGEPTRVFPRSLFAFAYSFGVFLHSMPHLEKLVSSDAGQI